MTLRSLKALFQGRERHFFDMLVSQARVIIDATTLLNGLLRKPVGELIAFEMKAIEKMGDARRRELIALLFATYATPFDREDVFELSRVLDDVLDAAEDFANEYASGIVTAPDGLAPMIDPISTGAQQLLAAVIAIRTDGDSAWTHVRRVKKCHNECHRRYRQAIRDLTEACDDFRQYTVARDLLTAANRIAQRLDDAANQLAVILVKRG